MALSPFFGTRAEVRWQGSTHRYHGWVLPESDGVLVLEVETAPGIEYGRNVHVNLMGIDLSTEFAGTFIGEEEGKAIFSVPPSFARNPGRPDARFRDRLRRAQVHRGGIAREVAVTEVGEDGMGLVLEEMVGPGEAIPVTIELFGEQVPFKLRVVTCRPDPVTDGAYRVSGGIEGMGRTDLVRWRKLLSQSQAA